jgi:serine/threonine protein kinase
MSPEQARGALELTPRTDVFALGCVLFECLTGAPPFAEAQPTALFERLLAGSVPRLRERRPDATPVLDAILARMLAFDPADRFADASSVALAFRLLWLAPPSARALYMTTIPRSHSRSQPRPGDARVEATAAGRVWLDEAVARHLAETYEIEVIDGHRALGPRLTRGTDTGSPYVGRARELATLEGTFAEVVGERSTHRRSRDE